MNDFLDYIFNLMDLDTPDTNPGLSAEELNQLEAKEVKPEAVPEGSVWIGSTMEAYGDRNYYRTPDDEYIYTFYYIGD